MGGFCDWVGVNSKANESKAFDLFYDLDRPLILIGSANKLTLLYLNSRINNNKNKIPY